MRKWLRIAPWVGCAALAGLAAVFALLDTTRASTLSGVISVFCALIGLGDQGYQRLRQAAAVRAARGGDPAGGSPGAGNGGAGDPSGGTGTGTGTGSGAAGAAAGSIAASAGGVAGGTHAGGGTGTPPGGQRSGAVRPPVPRGDFHFTANDHGTNNVHIVRSTGLAVLALTVVAALVLVVLVVLHLNRSGGRAESGAGARPSAASLAPTPGGTAHGPGAGTLPVDPGGDPGRRSATTPPRTAGPLPVRATPGPSVVSSPQPRPEPQPDNQVTETAFTLYDLEGVDWHGGQATPTKQTGAAGMMYFKPNDVQLYYYGWADTRVANHRPTFQDCLAAADRPGDVYQAIKLTMPEYPINPGDRYCRRESTSPNAVSYVVFDEINLHTAPYYVRIRVSYQSSP
ncbi:hypothetical protein [Longispora urticae]